MSDKNYIEFTEATFIAYINGELSAEHKGMVDHWLSLSEENQEEMDRIRKIWDESKNVKPKPVSVDTEKAFSNVMSQIQPEAQIHSIAPKSNIKKILFSAAAVIIVLFGAVTILNVISNNDPAQIELTADNNVLEDELSDGTLVSLNQNSMLTYPDEFSSNERRVKLTGEAFFDVERNEEKPFIIDLHKDFYVKVLGTSFNINANDEDSLTEVYVKSGKVEFGSNSDKIILVAGEKGVMNNRTGKVIKIVDELDEIKSLYWKSEELNFDHMSLTDALSILEAVFDVKIDLACEEKNNAQVMSKHQKESLDEILKVIASMHDLTITKTNLNYTLSCD